MSEVREAARSAAQYIERCDALKQAIAWLHIALAHAELEGDAAAQEAISSALDDMLELWRRWCAGAR